MMISPEGYYEMNLKGKNAKEIMTVIRGLKNDIGHLKNIMEHPDYGMEGIICPSESTRLWSTRLYLKIAKEALAEAGGVYTPSQAELKANAFQESILAINKVVFSIGGYFGGYETRTFALGDQYIYIDVEHSLIEKPSDLSIETN